MIRLQQSFSPLRIGVTAVGAVLAVGPLGGAPVSAQEPASAGPAATTEPEAVLDPTGVLVWRDGDVEYQIRFAPLAFPAKGVHILAEGDGYPQFWTRSHGIRRRATAGELRLGEFGEELVRGEVRWSEPPEPEERLVEFSLKPVMRPREPATVNGAREVPAFEPPASTPNKDDLVFCVLGSQGTGLSGQRRVAEAIAKLAPTGPLDFVLLAGDSLCPSGASKIGDPIWRTRFEQVYDKRRLGMPFYACPGDMDLEGDLGTLIGYGATNMRWTMPRNTYSFELKSHGKRLAFVAADTEAITGDMRNPLSRRSSAVVVQALEVSRADWRIVFGHQPMYSHGVASTEEQRKLLRDRIEPFLTRFSVDVYISGGDHSLQLLTPKQGITHIGSGGGGGPEVAESVDWADDTVFAHTGGGFVWFRFDGTTLEISFRDADGKVLYVHRMTKDS